MPFKSLLLKGPERVAACTTPAEMCCRGGQKLAACNSTRQLGDPQRKPVAVVAVDPGEDRPAGLGAGGPAVPVDELAFEAGPKRLKRFHRTLLDEWAYVRPYTREADRTRALARWLHRYNHHRVHTAIGGPPINRLTNLPTEHI